MSQEVKENEMGTKSVGRLLLAYSLPAILGMIIISVNHIISSIFIGYGVDPLALSAMAVTFPVGNIFMAFCQLIAVGCAAWCSIELGRKDMKAANSMLGHSVKLELMFSVVFGIIFWYLLDPMLIFFGASEDTLPFAHDFMVPLILTSPMGFLMLGLNFMARSTGYAKTAMMTNILSALGTVIFSPIFIYWLEWGMLGASLAQVMGQIMSTIWLVAHFARKTTIVHFQPGIWTLDMSNVRRILALGMAPFLMNFCACAVVVILNRSLLAYGGDMAVGAYGIVNRLLMLFAMSVVGLGQGMQPIIGYNFGAKRPDRVRLTLKYGMAAGTTVTALGMAAFLFIPEPMVRMFTDHEPLIAVSTHAMFLCGCMFIFVGPGIMAGTYFQAIGQAKIAAIMSLMRQCICLIPALLLLPRVFGLDGIWYSIPAADLAGFVVAAYFLYVTIKAEDNNCQPGDPECTPPSDFFKPKDM